MDDQDVYQQLEALVGQEVQVYEGEESTVGILVKMAQNAYTVGDSVLIFPQDVESIRQGLIYMADPNDGNVSYDD